MNVFTYIHRSSARLFAFLAVFSLLAGMVPTAAFAQGNPHAGDINPNITLCHSTNSTSNPYNDITTDAKSIVNLPNGHDSDSEDIIPPFDYNFGEGLMHYSGKNWTAEGQMVWNIGGCDGVIEVDVCPNISGMQTTVPSGKELVDGQCVDIVVPPVDVCPNLENLQTTVPTGYELVDGQCLLIVVDQCPNISGTQSEIPSGMIKNDAGQCVNPPVDMCPNIPEVQLTVPTGLIVNDAGECVQPPVDVCPNLENLQTTVPTGYELVDGQCMPISVDMCPNIPEVQLTVPTGLIVNDAGECVEPPVDVCPNLEGMQTTVPEGMRITDGQCVVIPPPPVEACELTVVSNITNTVDGNPAALTWVHPNWMQEISGSVADWIWGTEFVVAPAATTTQTFTKTFTWNGPVTAATLKVAADNSYVVKVNGVEFGAGDGFAAADVHDMTAFLQTNIVSGTNTLEIVATNWSSPTEDPQANPAGLIYDLNIVGNTSDNCAVVPDDGGDDEDKLSCGLTASDTSFRRGGDTTLSWNILNLMTEGVDAVLTNSVDDEEVDVATETGSRDEENVNQDTVYTLTVYEDYLDNSESEERESVTCSVSIDTTTGGGGRRTPDGDVAGDSTSKPEGQVLGEATSTLPVGAPNTGAGGTSHSGAAVPAMFAILAAGASVRKTK